MRPLSFSLIALVSFGCDSSNLDTHTLDSDLFEAELLLPPFADEDPDSLVIQKNPIPEPFLEPNVEPEMPELDADPDLDSPALTDENGPIGEDEPALDITMPQEIECGVFILKPRALELRTGERLMATWQVADDGYRPTHMGLVLENGEEQKLIALEGKHGTETLTLPTDLAAGTARLFIGSDDYRQSWFCKDSSHFEILP